MMRRTATVLAILAVACSGSAAYGPEDLDRIVLQADEAPADTQFVEAQSGALSAEDLTSDVDELAVLEEEGLLGAFDSIFASPGLAGVEGDISRSSARIVDSTALVYTTVEGASASFARLQADVPGSFVEVGTIFPISVDDLGDEAFAVRVEFFGGATGPDVGVLYTWRVENLILRLVVFGEVLEVSTDVRPIVDVVDARARA